MASPAFPQQSTVEQWYGENQFESYRRLGYDSAREAFGKVAVQEGAFGEIHTLFQSMEVGATSTDGVIPHAVPDTDGGGRDPESASMHSPRVADRADGRAADHPVRE